MSSFQLKVLAITFMVVDHVGLFFFPSLLVFRIIGRVAFPLFAWLIVNGIEHTRSQRDYFLRLLIFAFLSQIPFFLAFHKVIQQFWELNIFFTLCLGFLAIQALRIVRPYWLACVSVGVLLIISAVSAVSYGVGGVLTILICYLCRKSAPAMFLGLLIVFITCYTLPALILPHHLINTVAVVQPFGALAVFLIAFYNHQRGPKFQYFFYLFYPLHLALIYLLLRMY